MSRLETRITRMESKAQYVDASLERPIVIRYVAAGEAGKNLDDRVIGVRSRTDGEIFRRHQGEDYKAFIKRAHTHFRAEALPNCVVALFEVKDGNGQGGDR